MKNGKMILGVAVIVVVVVGIVFAANGKKNNTATPATNTSNTAATDNATSTSAVTISNFAFGPKTITVKAGTAVTWTNSDDVGHTVTADSPSASAPSSKSFNKGETYSFTFDKAGTYSYHCSPHPYMHGTVVVTQ